MENDTHHADADVPCRVGTDPNGSSGEFKTSDKLRARIDELADWRFDPSEITFPEGAREFHGGHAIVSCACIGDQLDVAVKKIRIADDSDFERVLGLAIREAEIVAELDHRNIVGFEGFVEDASKGMIWLVFPWAKNGNLRDFVAIIDWQIPERISLIDGVAQGLAYLHGRDPPICHGDLKSLNVLVDGHCRAAITDFGSARRLGKGNRYTQLEQVQTQTRPAQAVNATFSSSTNTITLTRNNYTLRWAAPELLNDDQVSVWSDIWALGWIAYEVMTNSIPFQDASSDVAVVERVLAGKLPSLTDNVHLSDIDALCSLMNMCWRINPTERPTADSCQRSIDQMPMFPPDLDPFGRTVTIEHLRNLGRTSQTRGEYEKACGFFVEAARASRRCDDEVTLLASLSDLAQMHRLRKAYDKVIPVYSEILNIPIDLCDRKGRADALWGLADVHRLRKEYAEAIPLYSEALEIRTHLGDRKGRASALWGLATAHRLLSEYDKAIPFYYETLEIRTDLGNRKGRASALWGLADVHRLQGEYDKAIPLYSEALNIRIDLDDRKGRADALWGLADVHRLKREYAKAILLYSDALEVHTDLGDGKGRSAALLGLAHIHHEQSRSDDAVSLYEQAAKIAEEVGYKEVMADALKGAKDARQLLQSQEVAGDHT